MTDQPDPADNALALDMARERIAELEEQTRRDNDWFQQAIVAMGNGVDEERWPSGTHVITALVAERDALKAKLDELTFWIPCSERMPEDEQQVWVRFQWEDGEPYAGFAIWQEETKDWFWEVQDNGDLLARSKAIKLGLDCAEVTHWRAIPQL